MWGKMMFLLTCDRVICLNVQTVFAKFRYVFICMYACMCICMSEGDMPQCVDNLAEFGYVFICMYVCMCICMSEGDLPLCWNLGMFSCVCLYTCMYLGMFSYVCICICMYISMYDLPQQRTILRNLSMFSYVCIYPPHLTILCCRGEDDVANG